MHKRYAYNKCRSLVFFAGYSYTAVVHKHCGMGYGKAKAAKIMEELGISATRRVQGLGVRQREQLLEQLTK